MRRIRISTLAIFLLSWGLSSSGPVYAGESETTPTPPYAALAAAERRVAAIGFRLTTANARWCRHLAPQLGWILGDPKQYDAAQWPLAQTAYEVGSKDLPFVAALAPIAPARTADIMVGMSIGAINDTVPLASDEDPFARIAAIERIISGLPVSEPVTVTDGMGTQHHLSAVAGCASNFRVEAKDKASASADGRLVLITAGLVQFTHDDNELAAALAHELAHNILRHRARLDDANVDRGLLKQFGRSARLFRQTEVEADRLSVWLMHSAGYDPDAAVRFWERFGQRNGATLFQAGTHPRWRARVQALVAENAILRTAVAAGTPLRPPLIDDAPPLQ